MIDTSRSIIAVQLDAETEQFFGKLHGQLNTLTSAQTNTTWLQLHLHAYTNLN